MNTNLFKCQKCGDEQPLNNGERVCLFCYGTLDPIPIGEAKGEEVASAQPADAATCSKHGAYPAYFGPQCPQCTDESFMEPHPQPAETATPNAPIVLNMDLNDGPIIPTEEPCAKYPKCWHEVDARIRRYLAKLSTLPTPEVDAARGFVGHDGNFFQNERGDVVPLEFARTQERRALLAELELQKIQNSNEAQ